MEFKVKSIGRACAGCTKCCDGWLSGSAYGYKFDAKNKCVFMNKGCSIYPFRPDDPCKTFECQWKSNRALPEWLKPDKSGVILLKKYIDIFDYLMVVPAGKTIGKNIHDWAKQYSNENIRNHVVIGDGIKFDIYSKHRYFRELAENKWLKGG